VVVNRSLDLAKQEEEEASNALDTREDRENSRIIFVSQRV